MTEKVHLPDLTSTPHAVVFDADPRVVRLRLGTGDELPAHRHPDERIVLHLLKGALELRLGETTHSLTTGDVIRFDGDQDVSPHAVEDAEALLVLTERATA
ncbi:cupin domain-containing protein [Halorussus halophilus]|uniref:cupin domain-containing protein n=1 Tax=Halorussus halophilus TaxID=2650975 RepID=UPI0013010C86|nr:cupin domain-containing protein [Halorussus halophilus]